MNGEINTPPSEQPQSPGTRSNAWILNGMILAGVVMMVVALAGLFLLNRPKTNTSTPEPGGPVRAGMRLTSFTLQDLDGKSVKLSDYAGRSILVNAWATWCPPCRAEMPALNTFYQQNRDKGFVILAVNAGESQPLAADFTHQYGLQFPVLLDPDESLMNRLGIHDYPTSILIGKDGIVKSVHVGMFTSDALERELLPLIQ